MHEDVERCVRAVQSKDARFDGWFFTGVLTTGIYCRPSCPVVPPKVENMRFYPSAAAAQQAGFRACKRCRPDTSPGSPEWNDRADLVARAMRLIADGVVDRDGVPGLAARLGYSTRQVERQLHAELGAGPLALARAQRAQTARLLIETTDAADERHRLRRRVRQHPDLQRHRARGVRALPDASCGSAYAAGTRRRRSGALVAAAAVPRSAVPRQPVRPPGRHRRARRRGVARRRVPPHPAAPARPRDRDAEPGT